MGQADKLLIINSFDSITYYSDSTINCAYSLTNGVLMGFAIEFDSLGQPKKIGKYKNGIKHGKWFWVNGNTENFKKGKSNSILEPSCSTRRKQSQLYFRNLYENLIGKKE